jgi:hypothetical protein
MRITIIPVDSKIVIDGIVANDVDLSWVPENVHAVQWFDTYGEIELLTREPNIDITELGIYSQAVPIWEVKKLELEEEERERIEQERLKQEEIQRDLIIEQQRMVQEILDSSVQFKDDGNIAVINGVEYQKMEEPITEENQNVGVATT